MLSRTFAWILGNFARSAEKRSHVASDTTRKAGQAYRPPDSHLPTDGLFAAERDVASIGVQIHPDNGFAITGNRRNRYRDSVSGLHMDGKLWQ